MYAAQAAGCGPIVTMIKKDTDVLEPVRPQTIAKSLAIGNPADGYYAYRGGQGLGRLRRARAPTRRSSRACELLARTEGIFAETAGGVTVAATRKLDRGGPHPADEPIVICITGNGLKTPDALHDRLGTTPPSGPARRPSTGRWPTSLSEPGRSRARGDLHGRSRPHSHAAPRTLTKGAAEVQAEGNVTDLIEVLERQFPGLRERLWTRRALRAFINIYINQEDIRFLEGADQLKQGDEVSIVPAIAGGR